MLNRATNISINTGQNPKADAIEKLFRIEVKDARKKSLLAGIFIGVLLIILIVISLVTFLWFNQEAVAERALDYVISGYMKDLFESFPDAYVSYNQQRILLVLDNFANAAAKHYVSDAEFKEIGKSVVFALRDKELTYHEIDDILAQMKEASNAGSFFD